MTVGKLLSELVSSSSEGSRPVGGVPTLPTEAAGGGPIYPELEKRVGNVIVFYAQNQKPDLLKVVTDEMPAVRQQVLEWFPSQTSGGTMFLILSGGNGGGWAVNAYKPEEVGIISLDREGILSIFARTGAQSTWSTKRSRSAGG